MDTQDRYIPGVPCWVDQTPGDPAAAAAFYAKLFDWEVIDRMPPEAPGHYFVAQRDGGDVAAIGSAVDGQAAEPDWCTYVWVEDADATAERAWKAGGAVVVPPRDAGPAGRWALLAGPQGATFGVWQAGTSRGATVVNAHGAVNFNDLRTTDLEGAKAFYGQVFGWDAVVMGEGNGIWALPAYGDFLEGRDPGMRARMQEMGAPDRFEEAVATFAPCEPGERPHWGVTFAVDDADAAAARAAELGGEVVVAPHDAPWVRTCALRDPQGGRFVASQFVPPSADEVAALASSQEA